jgi:malate synthase
VEIVGPVHAQVIINALNSGAKVFVADFEDMHSPTWIATLQGQYNLREAVAGGLRYFSSDGRDSSLRVPRAPIMVRPRGWHLVEKHLRVDGQPIAASLFDFGIYFFHNARSLLDQRSGPYFYLPKLESHLEARLWNQIFLSAQEALGIDPGSIKATVSIETVLAAFEMHEILFELKEHSAGLSIGKSDYIFSFIKKFRSNKNLVFPELGQVDMGKRFLKSYADLLIQTCHWRGAHAIGGSAEAACEIENEVSAGFDGTSVELPERVAAAMKIFNKRMSDANQFHRLRSDVSVNREDLLFFPTGEITEAGFRRSVVDTLLYMESWLNGAGGDTANAEILRAQIWQWMRRSKGRTVEGRKINSKYFEDVLNQELRKAELSKLTKLAASAGLLRKLVMDDEFAEFLTLPAYDLMD